MLQHPSIVEKKLEETTNEAAWESERAKIRQECPPAEPRHLFETR
jgi:hypothetical protein